MKTFVIEGVEIAYLGPDLDEGALPAVFYVALSKEESLQIDPFNQPAVFLEKFPLRVFSLTLPCHGPGHSPVKAVFHWAEELEKGNNIIEEYILQAEKVLRALIKKGIIEKERLGLMGLSRGGMICLHLAARMHEVQSILGFAPLTQLSKAKEFSEMENNALVDSLNVFHLIEKLYSRKIRFYIGNRDVRVGTDLAFKFITEIAEIAHKHMIRSPQAELIITPSIGAQGHGTSKEIFEAGALWMVGQIGVRHA